MATYQAKQHIIAALKGAAVGLIVQLLCIRYIKTHPELFNQSTDRKTDKTDVTKITKEKKLNPADKKPSNRIIRVLRNLNFRGGAFPAVPVLIKFLSESGLTLGIVSIALGYLGNRDFLYILYSSSPQNLPVKSLISSGSPQSVMVRVKELEWICDDSLMFLFKTLREKSIPFEERKKAAEKILFQHVNLTTDPERVKFVLCMIAMLLALYILNYASFLILINQLFEAVRAGKIPKIVYRAILRKLRGKSIIMDPDIIDIP